MFGKVDLVMWTRNGASTLPAVLNSISQVIPSEFVEKRVVVDDHSTDDTREIAQRFGWTVIFNEGTGISDGANTALRQVTSDYFISFEQDLVLAHDWWAKIPPLLSDPKVAVASGMRLPDKTRAVRKIQEYSNELYARNNKGEQLFVLGKTIDNTLYKTSVIRGLGGFPRLKISAGVDNVLAKKIFESGFRWVVDYSVVSTHLRHGLKQELDHYHWYGTCMAMLDPYLYGRNVNVKALIVRCLLSPVRGFDIAVKKRTPEAIIVHPLMRFTVLKGVFDGYKKRHM